MNSLFGMKIFVSDLVQPVPRIQVRDIKFKDGTSILSQKFLREINASLAEEWGYVNVAYIFQGDHSPRIAMNPREMAYLLKDYTL